jgi:hypothetical protein
MVAGFCNPGGAVTTHESWKQTFSASSNLKASREGIMY